MNPKFDQTPGLHLPQSSTGGQPPMQYSPQVVQATTPVQGSYPSAYPPQQQSQYQQPAPTAAAVPGGFQQPTPAQPVAAPTVTQAAPPADDDTVIDEEWVNKAREVVTRYSSDPFAQSRELSRVKAQYLKARYNKDIKVSEDK